jgi:hypothetical protein
MYDEFKSFLNLFLYDSIIMYTNVYPLMKNQNTHIIIMIKKCHGYITMLFFKHIVFTFQHVINVENN